MCAGSHDRPTCMPLFKITDIAATMTQPTIEYGDPQKIAHQLDQAGVVCLENVVPAERPAQARANVEDRLVNHGEHDHFIRSPEVRSTAPQKLSSTAPRFNHCLVTL